MSRTEKILERAAAYYQEFLLASAEQVRARLSQRGVGARGLRSFGVGYASERGQDLIADLVRAGYEPAELVAAGVARSSDRGRVHAYFHSRVMFPLRDPEGTIQGFAAMATSPGPSWPLWITSAQSSHFRRGAALFAIERAEEAIARSKRALVLDDCLDVIRLHESGEEEAVAVIRSPITEAHLRQLAAAIGIEPGDLTLEKPARGAERRLSVVRPRAGGEPTAAEVVAAAPATDDARQVDIASLVVPDEKRPLTRAQRVVLGALAAVLGAGIPLGWTAALRPSSSDPGGPGSRFVVAVGAVALTYIVLTVLASLLTGYTKRRSRGRRMRQPWERGATEWQPIAWTYHRFEELLIGAAIVSLVVCLVLFVTVGGFAG